MSLETIATDNENSTPTKALDVENSIDIYSVSADWIKFADAKAAVVLTVGGAMAGLLIPHLKPYLDELEHHTVIRGLAPAVLGCFALWLILLIASGVMAFRCILPDGRNHPARETCTHFHPAGISGGYTLNDREKFIESYERLGANGLRREVLTAVLIDAGICSRKYGFVTRSIQMFALSAVFGFLFLLLSQF